MSGPEEGMLTAQERAALASLEARAVADDPRLADHLRGLRAKRAALGAPTLDLRVAGAALAGAWARLRPTVWGPLLTAAGLLLAVLGLAVSTVLSAIGAGVAALGLALLVQVGTARVERLREEQRRLQGATPGD